MRVIVDQDKCCGAGQCVMAAPTIFDQRDEDGIVILLNETPPADKLSEVRQAIRVCPALAIKVEE
jgi:ferredoxin